MGGVASGEGSPAVILAWVAGDNIRVYILGVFFLDRRVFQPSVIVFTRLSSSFVHGAIAHYSSPPVVRVCSSTLRKEGRSCNTSPKYK